MRVPLSWLREYVAFDATAAELARRLAISWASASTRTYSRSQERGAFT